MATTTELPRISIKTEVKAQQARPFVGRIVNDSLQPARFNVDKTPYQWSLAVEPIKSADGTKGFQIGGKTGAFWEYIGVPVEAIVDGEIKEQTKFGRHFNAFKKVFGDDEDRAPGRGEYLNELAWFVKDTILYGTNKTDGSEIKGGVLLPLRALSPEEMVEYGLAARSTAPQTVELSDSDLDALAAALDGKDRNALQKAVYSAKLGNKLASAVGKGDGPAVRALVESGRGSFDGDTFRAS